MAEDFRKLLEFEMRQKKILGPMSPVAYLLCDLLTRYVANEAQHVVDGQQTASRAYAKAKELEERVAALEKRLV